MPLALLAGAAAAADPLQGRALYDARCSGCHNESVHNDASRKATNFEGVQRQVARWSQTLNTGWSAAEIQAVAIHLNDRYYGFPCPGDACAPRPAPAAPKR